MRLQQNAGGSGAYLQLLLLLSQLLAACSGRDAAFWAESDYTSLSLRLLSFLTCFFSSAWRHVQRIHEHWIPTAEVTSLASSS